MKTRTDNIVRHEGTLEPTSTTRFEFDKDSLTHIMSVLTDLYSDKEMAVIREYSANAWDSHRAAGITDPIEVTLPNQLSAVFVVKDHGVGLSVDELTQLFSKYGWSSKRETDSEVGMLGLGCKSGLTYTSQFTIVAVQNGIRTTALITRDHDGVGAIQVVDTVGTTDPNGVEIRIPVANPGTFNVKAKRFYSFWDKGTVLVDGSPPTRVDEDGSEHLWISPRILLKRSGLSADYIVMGNIAYPVPAEKRLRGHSGGVAVVWVDIGAVDFTPSREALHLTKRTLDLLKETKDLIDKTTQQEAEKQLAAATSYADAWALANKFNNWIVPWGTSLTYRGETVPRGGLHRTASRALSWPVRGAAAYGGRPTRASNMVSLISVEQAKNFWWVVGHNGYRLLAEEKEMLTEYYKKHWPAAISQGTGPSTVIVSPEPFCEPWLDSIPTTSWEDIVAEMKPQTAAAKRPKSVPYKTLQEGTGTEKAYMLSERFREITKEGTLSIRRLMEKFIPDVTVYVVAPRSVGTLMRHHPDAVPLRDVVSARGDAYMNSLSEAQAYIAKNGGGHRWARLSGTSDPVLTSLAAVSGDFPSEYRSWQTLGRMVGRDLATQQSTAGIQKVLSQYPLLSGYSMSDEHLTEYVEALRHYRTLPKGTKT